jgi:acid phosphatase family membrane protein YuiD
MKGLWGAEPSVITSVVAAAIGVAVAFGVHLSDTQISAITGLIAIVAGLVIRSQVTAPANLPAPPPAPPVPPVPPVV